MKRFFSLLLALCLTITLCPVFAEGPNGATMVQIFNQEIGAYNPPVMLERIIVTLDGAVLETDMPAVSRSGRTMIPLRSVAEALSAEVDWDQAQNQAVLRLGPRTLVLTLGSATALVDGLPAPLPDGVPAVAMRTADSGERTMVPLRFVSEQLGALVDWDQESYTALITSPNPPTPSPSPSPSPSPTPPIDPVVSAVTFDPSIGAVRIALEGTCNHIVTDLGDKLVLDFPGATLKGGGSGTVAVTDSFVLGVRYAQHDSTLIPGFETTVRVVLDRKPETVSTTGHTVTATADAVLVRIVNRAPGGTLPLNSSKLTIALDAGHGGKASGASYGGIYEKIPALQMTRKLETLFLGMGYNVIMTRRDDSFVTLNDRCKIANDAKADVFVSIHLNALENNTSYEGFLVCPYVGSEEGARLATLVGNAACASSGAKNRGYRAENFAVTRGTDMTAILIETGFMSSPKELRRLADDAYQQKLMNGVAEGVVQYLNEVQGREKVPDPPHPSGPPSPEGA